MSECLPPKKRPQDRAEYREENRDQIQGTAYLKQTADKIAQLRRFQDIVRENKELSDKAKRLRIDALIGRMVAFARAAVEQKGRREAAANQ